MRINKQAIKVSPQQAASYIQSGDRVMVSEGCGEPQTLLEALVKQKDRLRNVEIISGLLIDYKFLEPGLEKSFWFRTWQCTPKISKLIGKTVKYIPARMSEIPYLFGKDGLYPIDVSLIHVSPPDSHGFCSLGVSVGNTLALALESKLIIAEVNDQMPRVLGNCFLNLSQIDYIVETSRPLIEHYPRPSISDSHKILASYVSELIPDGATLQIGIGAIPEALVQLLNDKKDLKFHGMATDYMVDLANMGVISSAVAKSHQCKIRAPAISGTKKIFDFVHNNPIVEGVSSTESLRPALFEKITNFISVQSAFEIDIYGQVNTETIDGRQVSAIGGGFDFLDAVRYSPGGKTVIAMLSTTAEGTSRIVWQFKPGTAVVYPRHMVDYVATEYGVVRLKGKSLDERAKELISIAHPDFREQLRCSFITGEEQEP